MLKSPIKSTEYGRGKMAINNLFNNEKTKRKAHSPCPIDR